MVGFVFGIIFIIIGIIGSVIMSLYTYETRANGKTHPLRSKAWISWSAGVILGILFIFLGCAVSINTGHTGIITVFGRVEDKTLDAGFHLTAPWESVIEMDNRVQKATIELGCFSSDIQEVNCVYTLNYQIDKQNAQTIYKTVGISYYDTVITPNVSESVKTVMAHYTAEELIGRRDILASEVETLLEESLKKYNIELVSTAIEDLDFTDTFTNAVEAKQVAAQNKLKAEIEQAQAIKQAEADAEVNKTKAEAEAAIAKIQAEADLEVQKINADAAEYTGLKEAAKNKAVSDSLTAELIKYYLIQQWNGAYPNTYLGSDNVSTLLGIE